VGTLRSFVKVNREAKNSREKKNPNNTSSTGKGTKVVYYYIENSVKY
jgi:hypothetical protein